MKTDNSEYGDIKTLFKKNNNNQTFSPIVKQSNHVIIYPPTIDWDWMKQRPQHLMEQFSLQGFEVYYCNKTQSETKIYTAVNSNLKVIHNHNYFISEMIPSFKKQGKKIILWVSWAKLRIFLKNYLPDKIIYDYLDDFDVWRPYHENMVNMADIVFTSSTVLQQQIKQQFPIKKSFLLPNGCDTKHFKQEARIHKPNGLRTHKGPVIMYTGAWAKWIDQELVNKVAASFKEALVVIIGTEFGAKVSKRQPNVKYLGYKPYNTLPIYLKHSTVCLIPFKIEDITLAVNPIKMYEYLAAGKPVVSTNIPEARNIPSVYIGKDHESFLQKVRLILEGKITFSPYDVDDWLKQHTWQIRLHNVLDILKENGIYLRQKP